MLPELIEEAGIEVIRKDDAVAGFPGRLELPCGTRLVLTDGAPADGPDRRLIHFDLALDYRATRIALAPSATVAEGSSVRLSASSRRSASRSV